MNQNVCRFQNRRINTGILGDWLGKARKQIKNLPNEPTSSLYAIIGFALNESSHFGISHPEYLLTSEQEQKLDFLSNRLLSGEPLPYITGKQEFFGLEFKITPDVLIPRPETELMVECALNWFHNYSGKNFVADVGTGSGCIAVAIARNLPSAKVVGVDNSFFALKIAAENAKMHNLQNRILFIQSDLLTAHYGKFDVICANLPYIPTKKLANLSVTKHEPFSALDGGQNGLNYIEPLLNQSRLRINDSGLILLEIEATQAHNVIDLAENVFPEAKISLMNDLAGLPRLVRIEMDGNN